MRVPSSAENPTFDETFSVGFGKWLTSKSDERREWRRRRDAAAHTAQAGQQQRLEEKRDAYDARAEAMRAEKRDG